MIIHPSGRRKWPGIKRYAEADQGNLPQSLIMEPIGFTNYSRSKERVGYPTQKPLALLDRIIKASSNPGDMVLDPFCGCATACVAAERLDRKWVGIDISEKAAELVQVRIRQEINLLHLFRPIHRKDIPLNGNTSERNFPQSPPSLRKSTVGTDVHGGSGFVKFSG